MAIKHIKWPGDILTVPKKLRLTHKLLRIGKTEQKNLPGLRDRGGKEGEEARRKMEIVRLIVIRMLLELDVREVQVDAPGGLKKVVHVSRWQPEAHRCVVDGANDGDPDYFVNMLNKNWDSYFTKMELFDPETVGLPADNEHRRLMEARGIKGDVRAQQVMESDQYLDMVKWADAAYAKARAEVYGEALDRPLDPIRKPEKGLRGTSAPKKVLRLKPRAVSVGAPTLEPGSGDGGEE